jgi:Cof subfamily protein (haloacid dehalogenase superfamily)
MEKVPSSPPRACGPVQLIALDLDGTLLDDRKLVPAANREALREAAARGIQIALASGRMIPRIEPVQEMLGIDCLVIAYNGGKVVGSRRAGRQLIAHRPLPADVAELFIRFSQEHGYLLNFYLDDRLYAEDGPSRRPFMDLYSARTGAEYQLGDLDRLVGHAPTKLILLAAPAERDRLYNALRPQFSERAFITKSDPEYLEIMAPGVDKGAALDLLAQHLGLSTSQVLAVGDADNDQGMLAAAGWGVAMANAGPHVRAGARAVTSLTNNEGGVAEAVRRWALGGR